MTAASAMRALLAAALAACTSHGGATSSEHAPKLMILDMFGLEGDSITGAYGLTDDVMANGLTVHCNASDVCQVLIGEGYANAAASTTALIYSPAFDLTKTYFVIAGIAGMDPQQGTLGTAAWARYAVDFGFANELDAREMPADWPYGYLGIGTSSPSDPPGTDYRGIAFHLDDHLLASVLALSQTAPLADTATAQGFRAHYPAAPANQPPAVVQCDVVSSDTWFGGAALAQRARDWVKLATGGAGTFCASAQEDNATLEVLTRGAAAGKVDFSRVALLRTGSDFGAPYPGQTDADGLLNSIEAGGLEPSVDNLAKATAPVVDAIVKDWAQWQAGPPTPKPSTPR